MARNIKGITIEIGGDTSKLQKSLSAVQVPINKINRELRDVNQALKLDPKNTELLAQKQEVLKRNIAATNEKLQALKEAQAKMGEYSKLTDEQKASYNRLSAEIAKSENALSQMNDELEETGKGNPTGKLKDGIEDVGKVSVKVGDLIKANLASEAIIRVFDSVVGKVKDISSAIGNMVISGGIDRALNLENAKAKMSTFTKSSEQLDKIMQNVQDSVDGTAFSMDAAATVAAGLFAAGIKEGPEMEKSLKLVGDAAQVSGRSMEEIGAIFNKVAANGKLTGQELNQLSDSGIPVLQMLSDSTGKSVEEVRKLVSAGKIGFAEFSDAMEQGLGGAAQKSGETFTSSLANLKSACARIGATLMTPILEGVTPVMNTLKDMLKKLASGTTEGLDELADTLQNQVMDMVNGIVNNIGPFLEKIFPVLNNIIQKILEILPQALPQLITILVNSISQLIQILVQNLPQILNIVIQAIARIAIELGAQLPTLIPIIVDALINMVEVIIDNIDLFIDAAIKIILGLAEGLINALPKLIEKVPEIIQKLITGLINALPQLIEGLIQLVIGIVQNLPQIIMALINALPQIIKAVIDGLIKGLPQLIQGLIQLVILIVKNLPQIIMALIKALPQIIKAVVQGLLGAGGQLVTAGVQLIKRLWDGFKSWIGNLFNNVKNFAKSIPGKIKDGIGNIGNVGLNLVRGIWNGINNAKNWVLSKIKGFGKAILNGLKSFFGIHSPSTVMESEIGVNLGLGIIEGLEDTQNQLNAAMEELSTGITESVNPTINPTANSNPLIIQIENFNNTRESDIQQLAQELEFYRKNSALAKGGS